VRNVVGPKPVWGRTYWACGHVVGVLVSVLEVTFCLECAEPMTAQRSNRNYCSEVCRQRAKRARERAARWDELPMEATCDSCGGPLYQTTPARHRTGAAGTTCGGIARESAGTPHKDTGQRSGVTCPARRPIGLLS